MQIPWIPLCICLIWCQTLFDSRACCDFSVVPDGKAQTKSMCISCSNDRGLIMYMTDMNN